VLIAISKQSWTLVPWMVKNYNVPVICEGYWKFITDNGSKKMEYFYDYQRSQNLSNMCKNQMLYQCHCIQVYLTEYQGTCTMIQGKAASVLLYTTISICITHTWMLLIFITELHASRCSSTVLQEMWTFWSTLCSRRLTKP